MVSHPQNNAVDSRHIVTAHYQERKIWMLKIMPWEAHLAEWKCRTRFGQKRALQSRQQRESRRNKICNQQTVTKNKTANAKKSKLKWKYTNNFHNTYHHLSPSSIIRKQPVDTDHPVWLKRRVDVHYGHCRCHCVEEGSCQALGRSRTGPAARPAARCPARRVHWPHLQHTETERLSMKDSSPQKLHSSLGCCCSFNSAKKDAV